MERSYDFMHDIIRHFIEYDTGFETESEPAFHFIPRPIMAEMW